MVDLYLWLFSCQVIFAYILKNVGVIRIQYMYFSQNFMWVTVTNTFKIDKLYDLY